MNAAFKTVIRFFMDCRSMLILAGFFVGMGLASIPLHEMRGEMGWVVINVITVLYGVLLACCYWRTVRPS